ncbi:carbamoyl-phosphate synthase, large subunit [Vulcanisaeta moutnovskia 768-28]|uniref:Carbamoyl-phosphate synthase, large subunit n=1 Tax=Vulcanisaeta moutnovskia (strain 768-28) TaxID=985053 RepID=F0QTN4_VULM7|nr:carbamoyl-phosphate synthase (glutamine-hydrolyzing) large subunit [Vulcanisaeta moutnovskia]ADY01747.1 carbamoyl-phosphate synthase, large subunit [Vulcanisaeta moutnovskia 768-28]
MDIRKVLVIGSGPIKVAEAAEFDYSGIQALKAYREEGLTTVLVNPNIATVQTTRIFADRVYLAPIRPEFLVKIIERERPDGIACGFGGQTALSACVNLNEIGVFKKYGVKVLGTPIEGIRSALSRELFKELMSRHGISVLPSITTYSPNEALDAANKLGYPVLARVSFNLGGAGAFVAYNSNELASKYHKALAQSEIKEVLIEKYIGGWKEIEFEVMRDSHGNSVAVVCMENIDPMGIHTGDSAVVAPCLTLTNDEYQRARLLSIGVANAINLIGECNVQVAINPAGPEMYVIETNPRMSRSSALASKASGYPLAYIAAKLTLGYRLDELINKVTNRTVAAFEPSLDYIVVKIPRWESDRFEVDESLGPEMMSIGEVMGIGRTLEEAWQKAVRMLDIGEPGLVGGRIYNEASVEEARENVMKRKPYWFLYAAVLLREEVTVDEISKWTGVDKFFLNAIKRIVDFYEGAKRGTIQLSEDVLEEAYVLGFSEEQLRNALGKDVQAKLPVVKQIDTLAGEWPASTNYLYLTHGGEYDDNTGPSVDALVVGAGVFRIGVSVEFDWAVVNTVLALRRLGLRVGIINYNPETVSTDWDFANKLFFDELTPETLRNMLIKEKPKLVVLWAGGQIGQRLYGKSRLWINDEVKLLGTSPSGVDLAEDRVKFSKLLDELGLDQPPWTFASSLEELISLVERWLDYPVIVRPSYVLGGAYMGLARDRQELIRYISKATRISPEHPVVVSKYINNGVEVEVDGVSDSSSVIVVPVEHIEPPGVHSGDSTMVIPPRGFDYRLSDYWRRGMAEASFRIAKAVGVKGPFNIQFIVSDKLYVIEANVRASRSMPFTSKAVGINLMDLSVKAALNGLGMDREYLVLRPKRWWVKTSQFSWSRVRGAYPRLGPVMYSTGEVASSGRVFEEALLKAWLSTIPSKVPRSNALIYTYDKYLENLIDDVKRELNGWLKVIGEPSENVLNDLKSGRMDIVITGGDTREYDYAVRRLAADTATPIILHPSLGLELARSFKWLWSGNDTTVEELWETYINSLF